MEITLNDVIGYILAHEDNGMFQINEVGEAPYKVGVTDYVPAVLDENGEIVTPEKLREPIYETRKFQYTSILLMRNVLPKEEDIQE